MEEEQGREFCAALTATPVFICQRKLLRFPRERMRLEADKYTAASLEEGSRLPVFFRQKISPGCH